MYKIFMILLEQLKVNVQWTFNEPIGQNLSEEHQKDIIMALLYHGLWHFLTDN